MGERIEASDPTVAPPAPATSAPSPNPTPSPSAPPTPARSSYRALTGLSYPTPAGERVVPVDAMVDDLPLDAIAHLLACDYIAAVAEIPEES